VIYDAPRGVRGPNRSNLSGQLDAAFDDLLAAFALNADVHRHPGYLHRKGDVQQGTSVAAKILGLSDGCLGNC
jgi:hypothetical protein